MGKRPARGYIGGGEPTLDKMTWILSTITRGMMTLNIQSKYTDYDGLLSKISQSVYFEVQKILQQEKISLAQTLRETNN